MSERHRLDLVVRDVDHRCSELRLQVLDLGPHVRAQLRVQVGERLVHEKDLWSSNEGAGQRDALLLPSGQPLRFAVQEGFEPHEPRGLLDACTYLRLGESFGAQREGQVVSGLQVRVERIELEDHRDITLRGRQVVDQRVPDADVARRLTLQTRHGA